MNVRSLLKILFSRHQSKDIVRLIEETFKVSFPNINEIKKAMAAIGESLLYISYQAKSIEFNVEDVQQDLVNLKYEMRSVRKSYNRFKDRLGK